MKRFLKWTASIFTAKNEAPSRHLLPETPFYAIGDIHGRYDLLQTLLARIAVENSGGKIVCVGDYVDRGEQSLEVLNLLFSHANKTNSSLHCLIGNHEEMMLSFLESPEIHGPRWLRNGGLQTLASFGIRGVSQSTTGQDLVVARDTMRGLMGGAMETWLRSLPAHWLSGNIAVVHAGVDPELPISLQQLKHLLWGHPKFLNTQRSDDIWVVHGHTIVPEPTFQNGRIAIDTGAYATGRLTAAYIAQDEVRFLTTWPTERRPNKLLTSEQ